MVDFIPVFYHTMHATDFHFQFKISSHTIGQSDDIMPVSYLF